MSSSSKNNKVTKVKITTSKVKSKAKSRTKSKTKAKAKSKAAKKTSIKPSLKNKLKNKILYVLDASGSMNGLRYDVMRAFNSNLQTAKTKSKESNQQTSATLTTFGEAPFSHPIVKLKDIDVNLVTELNAANYAPYGNTPLLDAVGQTINLFKNDKDPNTSFVMFVVTDGQENCSETLDHELVNHGKFSHFHFLKFCGKYELVSIAEQAASFAEMFSVTGIKSPHREQTETTQQNI